MFGRPRIGRELTPRELFEWEEYFAVEPFGPWRQDVHEANALRMMHNLGVVKEHHEGDIRKFMIFEKKVAKTMTLEEQVATAQMIVAINNMMWEQEERERMAREARN